VTRSPVRAQGAEAVPERLAREDLAILRLESPTVAGHTLKIAILDPPAGRRRTDAEVVRAGIADRIVRVARLRRRLYTGPQLSAPAWVDDPSFDVRDHVRAVPGAISHQDLRRTCARMMEEHLDRSRPLWTIDVLAPFEHGGAVIVWKLHHSMADGVTAMRLVEQVLWDGGTRPEHLDASQRASMPAEVRRALAARRPERLPGTLRRELSRARNPSPFEGPIGASRVVAFVSVPLGSLKRSAKALAPGATVNDAILALVTGGLRRWATGRRDSLGSVRVKVPVSLHNSAEGAVAANRNSYFCVALPVAEPDPAVRLRRITEETEHRKRAGDPLVLDTLLRDASRVAPPVGHLLERLTLHPRAFALNVSNLLGPVERPSVLGAPVRAFYSLAEIDDRHGLRVAVVSMADELHFGLCADPAIVGDLDSLVVGIWDEAAALVRSAGRMGAG
jgi:WS/DGAT/MGAT family acyltransferase